MASVSAIIPAYNYARYLAEAIGSALTQTHKEIEVIVVDDGSSDDTRDVVARFSDQRLRYIWQANAGLSAARNTGIREARFPIVAFLDADDVWERTHIADALVEFARRDPRCAVVASAALRMDQNGVAMPTRLPARSGVVEIPVRDAVMSTRFMPSSAVVRREAFDRCGGFDTRLRSSEDREMWIRIAEHFQVVRRSEASVRVRKHPNNMSKQADRMSLSMRTVITHAYNRNTVPRESRVFWAQAWALFHIRVAWMLHDEGRRVEALAETARSLLWWPLPMEVSSIGEPPLFRLRAFVTFLLAPFRK